ncbi:class I SAM-dependent methyltransferase [Candidatus Colwellia aromaticivorans]|uniref:class I SAM-dependent methyltransferase n=1 Tax=Candidatus Colwellia aromaticivorans TaxID=2267621 RepID=UPI000DF43669|nr:methyltransferase domain-containing protein [Candidatus Colwellia aromaticivorans]
MQHSPLISKYLKQLENLNTDKQNTVLDLACGSGRNGLYLIENGISVTFADVNSAAIEQVQQHASLVNNKQQASFWLTDFEEEGETPLVGKSFAAIIVFRYLHRPLFKQIKQAILPNGLIIYETFTTEQAQFGRPKKANFLLKAGELADIFSDWQILHSFEGIIESANASNQKQAIAQIVARKPNLNE